MPLLALDVELRLAAHQVLDLVGPDPGRVDDDAGTDLEVAPALEVARAYADDAVAVAQEAVTLVRVATWAPLLAAVRAMVITSRASSTWQS